MIMSFCKKSVNWFVGLSLTTASVDKDRNFPPLAAGLGLVAATSEDPLRSLNVIQSSTVKSHAPSTTKEASFVDDIIGCGGGGFDGLMYCTESLGFESSDERMVGNKIKEMNVSYGDHGRRTMRRREKGEVKSYPPPIPSLSQNGQPSFFLRPVRRDGKLELREVRIERPEILRASREDGRLRLHLVREEDLVEGEEEEEEEEEEVTKEKEEVEEEEDEEDEEEREKEEEKVDTLVKFQVNSGEGSRPRCLKMLSHQHHNHHHHHHHNMQVWSQRCVTTR